MKTLTLTQPWASLVALGVKTMETRSWKTTYRGPIAIHAAASMPSWAREVMMGPAYRFLVPVYGTVERLERGMVVAIAELVDIVPTSSEFVEVTLQEAPVERHFGNFGPDRYAWLLANVRRIDPIVARGALGLWDWKPTERIRVIEEHAPVRESYPRQS